MNRYALLVGNSNYEDPALRPLPSAVRDVKALQQILINPEIGGFAESEVRVLMDADRKAIEDAIYDLFADRKRDDLLLFYFSGHGVTEPKSKDFYLTTSKTLESKAPPSSVWAGYIHLHMNNSNSKCKVIILDCCFSGAFTKGIKGSGTLVDIVPQFAGEGRAILTASNSSQYAFEEPGYKLSLYTHFLVEGLKTGEADLNKDGNISVFELHEYVEEKVRNINDCMSPQFDNHNKGREIILAKAALNNSFKFRKEVEEFAHDSNGELSIFAKVSLDVSRQELGIAPVEAETIINEVLRPYQEYAKKLEVYEQALRDAIAHKFPFSKVVQAHLQKYENRLVLREEDLQVIKERILAPKQAEYEQQLQAAERQAAELLQRRQAELLRQQQLEAERRLEAEKQREKLATGKRLAAERPRAEPEQELTLDLGQGIILELVRIPSGKFMMGSNEYDREKPIHEVTVPEFLIGKYAVTNAQWEAVMGTKPAEKYDIKFQGKNQPVVGVSWDYCVEFCKKLSSKLGKNITLPSEAEWEYACRANTTTPFHFGATITTDLVNYDGNYPYGDALKGEYRQKTVDVDSFSPNFWGLYQMHGNVWEWCSDHWHKNYNDAPKNGSSWETGTVDNIRVIRGGSWFNDAIYCRSANRYRYNAGNRYDDIGFRLVVS